MRQCGGRRTLAAGSDEELELALALVVADDERGIGRRIDGKLDEGSAVTVRAIAGEAADASDKVDMSGDVPGEAVGGGGTHDAATSELVLEGAQADPCETRQTLDLRSN